MSVKEPYGTELVHATEFEALVSAATQRPGMYVGTIDYNALASFIDGFDCANAGGPLIGLHQWLVLKLDGHNSVAWPSSVLATAGLTRPNALDATGSHEEAIQALGEVFTEFFQYRREVGLTKIFYDYAQWLLSQSWYEGPLRG
jgi:hypothetical protein